jgi:hypothetical protein
MKGVIQRRIVEAYFTVLLWHLAREFEENKAELLAEPVTVGILIGISNETHPATILDNLNSNTNNNSIHFFIIYMPSQQRYG